MQFQATTDLYLWEYLFLEMIINRNWFQIQNPNVCCVSLILAVNVKQDKHAKLKLVMLKLWSLCVQLVCAYLYLK